MVAQPSEPAAFLQQGIFRTAALICGIAVVLGAFGAHALQGVVNDWYDAERAIAKLESWETGVRYQFFHGLALMVLALAADKSKAQRRIRAAAWLFFAGILIFSGGLYLWVLTDLKAFVMAVPVGGVALIGGWSCLAACPFASPSDKVELAGTNS